jgi:hypothetical protein
LRSGHGLSVEKRCSVCGRQTKWKRVISYALSTQGGDRPIYITCFDLQPESARAYNGSSKRSMEACVQAIRFLDSRRDEHRAQAWSSTVGPALGCKALKSGKDAERAPLEVSTQETGDNLMLPRLTAQPPRLGLWR